MKDYRITLALVIPISIALVGVLWILKKKKRSQPDDEPRKKRKSVGSDSEVINKSTIRTQLIENEGITVTQRKIPETLARDRGGADIKLTHPDNIAGTDRDEKKTFYNALNKCKPAVKDETTPARQALTEVNDMNKPVVDNVQPTEANQSLCSQLEFNQPDPQETQSLQATTQLHLTTTQLHLTTTQLHLTTTQTETSHSAGEIDSQTKPDNQNINYNEHKDSFSEGGELVEPRDEILVLSDGEKRHSIESMTLVEKAQVDQLVISALGDGLLEAQSQLVKQSAYTEDSIPVNSTSSVILNESKTVDNVVTGTNHESKQLSTPHDAELVDLDIDLVMTPADATIESLTLSPEVADRSMNTTDMCSSDNSAQCCDKLEIMQVKKDITIELVKYCDQFNVAACLSPIKEKTTDGDVTEKTVLEDETNTNNFMDAEPSLAECSLRQDDNKNNLPCNDTIPSSFILPSSPLDSEHLSPDQCTDYKINWSTETATDTPTGPESAVTNSSVSSIQMSENTSLIQETSDTGVETTLQSNDALDSHTSAPNDHKQGSPIKSNSPMCDNNSEGSNDSGRGGSEHDVAGHAGENLVHFDFNMPSELCGRFIGKQGKNINFLKSKTGANVSLINNPYTADFQICQVVGTQAEVDDALAMIRRKFPLGDFPLLTMAPINLNPVVPTPIEHPLIVPEVMQLSLPEGVSVEVFVSAIVNAGHIFVQQPTHRSFMSLEKLTYFLNTVYGQDPNVPCVPTPVEYGIICVCENDGCWYRAMIMSPENEEGETQVKFVDYGGYAMMPVSCLKQIRTDFMSLPFQAVECFMANITPNQGEAYFSEEATMTLGTMTEYKLLQCQVVARTENGIPYIHLYQVSPESNSAVMINRALVNSSLVRWIEIL